MGQAAKADLSTSDVAKMVGLSSAWVRKQAQQGLIPCYDLGRWRFNEEEIEAWIQERKKPCRSISGAKTVKFGGISSNTKAKRSGSRLDQLLSQKPADRKWNTVSG